MEVRINGILADTFNSIVAITREGFDFSDLKKRFLGRTNRFLLPRTNTNADIFDHPDVLASTAKSFEVAYNCDVSDQGTVVIKGGGELSEAGKDYKLQVVDGAKVLFDSLSESLKSLDLDSSDFQYNDAAYDALKDISGNLWLWCSDQQYNSSNPAYSGITPSPVPSYTLLYLRPHFLIRNILDKIFNERGWTLNFPDAKIDEYVMTANHKEFYFTSYEKVVEQSFGSGTAFITDLNNDAFQHPDIDTTNSTLQVYGIPTAIRLYGPIEASRQFTIAFSSLTGEPEVLEEFVVEAGTEFIDIKSSVFSSESGSNIISILVTGTGGSLDLNEVRLYTLIEENDFPDWNPSDQPPNIDGPFTDYLVKTRDNIADINQVDLFKEVLMLVGLGFNVNLATQQIDFFNYSDLTRDNAIDWSDKFVFDTESITVASDGLGRATFLKYTLDDLNDASTGKGSFAVDNVNLPAENTLITSDFAASNTPTYSFDTWPGGPRRFDICEMNIYEQNGRYQEAGLRIKKIYDIEFAGFGPITTFAGLDWNDLKAFEYKTVFEALQRGRYIDAQFNLKKLDVIGFNFSNLIWIEQKKSYFIVVKISNYIPGRLTTCTILKVN